MRLSRGIGVLHFFQKVYQIIALNKFHYYKMLMPERIYNSHYGNGVPAMFTSYCCPTERQTLLKTPLP